MIYKIAVTGGIASGKSKCLQYLATKPHIATINLDLVAHRIYETSPHVVHQMSQRFGEDIVNRETG